jgi:hypothetical protein
MGLSIIPVRIDKTPVVRRWKKNQSARITEAQVLKHLANPDVTGLAVILGAISGGLCCRDFDKPQAYQRWAVYYPDLALSLPTVKTGRGYHVYFKAGEIKTQKLSDGELRGHGGYCVLPPSKHPNGSTYSWLREIPPEGIPSNDPDTAGLSHGWVTPTDSTERSERTERIERIEEVYIRGESREKRSIEILSVEDAVKEALPQAPHQNHHCLFILARGLRTLQEHRRSTGTLAEGEEFPLEFLRQAFNKWAEAAGPFLKPELTRDDYFIEFLELWDYAVSPFGDAILNQAFEAAQRAGTLDPAFKIFSDEQMHLLCAFCRELQRRVGGRPFFLSCRTVQKLFGLGSYNTAALRLRGLVKVGILDPVKRGGCRQATRYRYLLPLDEGLTMDQLTKASTVEEVSVV